MTTHPESPEVRVFPDAVRDSTPTATAVYAVLNAAGPLTYDQIIAETGAGRTAVENAVADLRDSGIVGSKPDPNNPRRQVHNIVDSFDT